MHKRISPELKYPVQSKIKDPWLNQLYLEKDSLSCYSQTKLKTNKQTSKKQNKTKTKTKEKNSKQKYKTKQNKPKD